MASSGFSSSGRRVSRGNLDPNNDGIFHEDIDYEPALTGDGLRVVGAALATAVPEMSYIAHAPRQRMYRDEFSELEGLDTSASIGHDLGQAEQVGPEALQGIHEQRNLQGSTTHPSSEEEVNVEVEISLSEGTHTGPTLTAAGEGSGFNILASASESQIETIVGGHSSDDTTTQQTHQSTPTLEMSEDVSGVVSGSHPQVQPHYEQPGTGGVVIQSERSTPDPQPSQEGEGTSLGVTGDFAQGETYANLQGEGVSVSAGGLPSVASILGQSVAAASLNSSGLMDELLSVDSEAILRAGPHRVVTGHTRRNIDVHTQVMFAVAARYYASAPTALYDEETVRFLSYTLMCTRGAPPRTQEYDSILNSYQSASGEGLDHIFTELAGILIPIENGEEVRFNILPPTQFNQLLEELQTVYPEAVIVYNMAYQFVRGELRCISPIPVLLVSDSQLSLYLNSVGSGVDRIRTVHVIMEPRAATLPTIRSRSETSVPLDTTQPMRALPQTRTAPAPGIGSHGIGAYGLGQTPRVGYQNRPNQLMPQGAPTPVRVERNTTEFRESVDQFQTLIRRIETLEQEVRGLRAENVHLNNEQRAMQERITSLDITFSGHIQRYAHADLQSRATLNRTLLTVEDAGAREQVQSQPPLNPMPANTYQRLVDLLTGFNAQSDVPSLVRDVKAALIQAGEVNSAGAVVASTITVGPARRRLIAKLRSYAVEN